MRIAHTGFVGRDRELAAIAAGFAARERLVTLVGAAGMGKTRLAQRFAEHAPRQDIYFCDLTECHDQEDVVCAMARALALHIDSSESWRDVADQVGHALASRGDCVAVLDNAEPCILAAARAVEHWLRMTKDARFLVTSREPLDLASERRIAIGPLPLGDARELCRIRICAARDGDPPTASDEPVVEAICLRLDCMPLAIELAAARSSVMSLAALLARLQTSFAFLSGTRRDRAAHHESMYAAVAWSWQLLDPVERAALAQCSVFRGGFGIADAEAVLALPHSPPGSPRLVLDVVQALIHKSLLYRLAIGGSGEQRHDMFAIIREVAQAHLVASGGRAAVEHRHLCHFLARAEAGDAPAAEVENLLAAHARVREREPVTAARLVAAMDPILARRGPAALHRELIDRAIAALGAAGEPRLRARLHAARALCWVRDGDGDAAERDIAVLERLAGELADDQLAAQALEATGRLALNQLALDRACGALGAAHARFLRAGDRRCAALVLSTLGEAHHRAGDAAAALVCYDAALEMHRSAGDREAESLTLRRRGSCLWEHCELERGRADLTAALAMARATGDEHTAAQAAAGLGMALADQREHAGARTCLTDALAGYRRTGNRRREANTLVVLARVDLDGGKLAGAEALLCRALELASSLDYPWLRVHALANLGIAAQLAGDLDRAERHLLVANELSKSLVKSSPEPTVVLAHLAAVHAVRGELTRARGELAECRQRMIDGKHSLLTTLADVIEGFFELAEASRALASGDRWRAHAHIEGARRRLDAPGMTYLELRAGQHVLAAAITLHQRSAGVLRTTADGSWFELFDAPRSVLAGKPVLRGLLAQLVRARHATPGKTIACGSLIRALWPEQRGDPSIALNRLRVAVASLRKHGLQRLIIAARGGYHLDAAIPLEIEPVIEGAGGSRSPSQAEDSQRDESTISAGLAPG